LVATDRIRTLGRLARQHRIALLISPINYTPRSNATTPPQSPSHSPSKYVAPPPSPAHSASSGYTSTSSLEIPLLAELEEERTSLITTPVGRTASQDTTTSAELPATSDENTASQGSVDSLAVEPSFSQTSNAALHDDDNESDSYSFSSERGSCTCELCTDYICASNVRVRRCELTPDEIDVHDELASLFSNFKREKGYTMTGMPILMFDELTEDFIARKAEWAQGSARSLKLYDDLLAI
jgi:hypothetical protein